MLQISLAAEKLFDLGPLPITNALLTTWLVIAVIGILSYLSTRSMTIIPGKLQMVAELIVEGLYDFFHSVSGKYINQFFILVATMFLYILFANWIGLLPGVGTIGFFHGEEFTPLFRAPMADLNTTLALAFVAVIAMQYYGFKNLGKHYTGRFFDFRDPILFSVGLLEVVSDFSKILSFAFRLFGNIFAGEVLLAVMAFLMPFIVPLPFLALELFVGIIQALVFSMLSTAFFTIAVSHGEGDALKGGEVHG